MPLEESQSKIINLFAMYEESLNILYTEYEKKFNGEISEFWHSIANDEASHATWVRKFHDWADNDEMYFTLDRFDMEKVTQSVEDLKIIIKNTISKDTISIDEAFQTALAEEKTPIERHYFDIVKTDHPDFKALVSKLTQANEIHTARMEQMYEKVK